MSLNNTSIDSIMQEYDRRQMDRHRLIEQRKKEIYEAIPEYRELENRIASESIKAGLASLTTGASADTESLKETIEELKRKKGLLLTGAGYSINYLNPPYVCPDCKDTGYIGTEMCHCFKQAKLDGTYLQSNARLLLKEENFDNISHEYHTGEELTHFIEAEKASRNLVANFEFEHGNILFKGTAGTGKSYLSNCIANALIQKGYSVIYFSAVSLFEKISSYKFGKDKNSMDNPLQDIYTCDLLVIDDLGSELTNQFVCQELFTIVNERHLRNKSTVISTNLDYSEISQRYTERIFSRIYSYYDVFDLSGNDIRVYKKRIEQRK
ncbi:MAG: ATP-binding protein [Lachnospiraceae bacterium]|nr:ATP-binding protein [Lachnospiraceae bacterium]MBR5067261.1 ATP-binding protein [Lachnospiraceae bacterium]MBR5916451.1 ATP-binding protein [Lachnospiraceae bacterium]